MIRDGDSPDFCKAMGELQALACAAFDKNDALAAADVDMTTGAFAASIFLLH